MKNIHEIFGLDQITPAASVEFIKDYIKDKIVYDFGCGDGSWMKSMSKYAKRVVGVEVNPVLAKFARKTGFEIIEDDFVNIPLDNINVIYVSLGYKQMARLEKKILDKDNLTIISYFYGFSSIKPTEIIRCDIPHVKGVEEFSFLIYKL